MAPTPNKKFRLNISIDIIVFLHVLSVPLNAQQSCLRETLPLPCGHLLPATLTMFQCTDFVPAAFHLAFQIQNHNPDDRNVTHQKPEMDPGHLVSHAKGLVEVGLSLIHI